MPPSSVAEYRNHGNRVRRDAATDRIKAKKSDVVRRRLPLSFVSRCGQYGRRAYSCGMMAGTDLTPDEMEAERGERLRTLRLFRNLGQKTLAALAGVSVRALRDLESGRGSRVKTLVCVLCALGLQDWINTIAPPDTISPSARTREKSRQRASHSRLRRAT